MQQLVQPFDFLCSKYKRDSRQEEKKGQINERVKSTMKLKPAGNAHNFKH